MWWLLCCHPVFFILFIGGGLVIWSLLGGAICRLAAVQFARDDRLTVGQGVTFASARLLNGFLLAPCLPLAFAAIVALLLAAGGLVLRVWVIGDLLAGLAFILALIGGFIIAVLLLGLLVGGSLMWPVVATEGSDAFDAFSRALSYPFSKPWKAILYGAIAIVYAGVCWLFVNWFTYFALSVTRTVVAFGTSPFGWWGYGPEGAKLNKMKLLWPLEGPSLLYSWPKWADLAWYEYFSAVCIGLYVLLVIAVMWSFLASFYFSTSTIVYFLLRRDVDGTDLEEVYCEEEGAPPGDPPSMMTESKGGPTEGQGISLPVANPP